MGYRWRRVEMGERKGRKEVELVEGQREKGSSSLSTFDAYKLSFSCFVDS